MWFHSSTLAQINCVLQNCSFLARNNSGQGEWKQEDNRVRGKQILRAWQKITALFLCGTHTSM